MIITQTPLRISFFGGGTDFKDFYQHEEGCVLSSTIDKYIYVIVKRRFDEMIRIGYTKTELVDDVGKVEHELVREALRLSGVNSYIEVGTLGDIPSSGSGLGSSSTVTVGVLNALYHYLNEPPTQEKLAQQACQIEINKLGKPIGKQDQYIASYGGFRFIRFLLDGGVEIETIDLSESESRRLNQQLLLFYTNNPRTSESILTEQKSKIPERMETLRELKNLAYEARTFIETGNFDDFGRLLDKGWQLKRSLTDKISTREIDKLYQIGLDAGALGGKITGAGGGGFLLLYCPREKQYNVREAEHAPRHLGSQPADPL